MKVLFKVQIIYLFIYNPVQAYRSKWISPCHQEGHRPPLLFTHLI